MLSLLFLSHLVYAAVEGPVFQSRSDLNPPIFTVLINNKSLVTPGYFFVAPYSVVQSGPYIYDNSGQLVWSGFGDSGAANSHDFKVITYMGSDHLSFFNGDQASGFALGHGLILDDTYNIVRSVQTGNGVASSDQHEFRVINNGTQALMTMFRPVQFDLSQAGITDGQGWLLDGVFQNVNVTTREVLFEWHASDHVPLNNTEVLPNGSDISGDGLSAATAWDWFHINSVDRFEDGDYLISSRHTSCIYKINQTNGDIIWKLGGRTSTFDIQGFNFSFQHDARVRAESNTSVLMSFFDNASNGFNQSRLQSSGKMVELDLVNKTATLVRDYQAPLGGLLSTSQGNLQLLGNGNRVVGWGSIPAISEYSMEGDCVFYGNLSGGENYRAYKFNFTSSPLNSPSLYTFAQSNNATAETFFAVSWNGATEVATWRFYGAVNEAGLYEVIGSTDRNGFETTYTDSTYHPFCIAEAINVDGKGLKNSTVTGTFVPSTSLAQHCDTNGCPLAQQANGPQQILARDGPRMALRVSIATSLHVHMWSLGALMLAFCILF